MQSESEIDDIFRYPVQIQSCRMPLHFKQGGLPAMPAYDHWIDLTTTEIIKEAAQFCYGAIPLKSDLAELPEGMDIRTAATLFEEPWAYMWSADSALRMLTDLPNNRSALQAMLASATVEYHDGDADIWFSKTWNFPDGTDLEMIVPRQPGPIGYCTGHDPTNILATHERI